MALAGRQIARLRFLRRVIASRLARQDYSCPYCANGSSVVIARKRSILDLRRCTHCGLMFRWPKDSVRQNFTFYQNDYSEGLTTRVPDEVSLRDMKERCFRGTEHDFSEKIQLLQALVPSGLILDFGCSWGYGTYQLSAAGYEAVGFEISRPRAEFARTRMGVQTIYEPGRLDCYVESFDAIFAAHVLEHLPSLNGTFDSFFRLLKPNGLLLAFVPNCSGSNANRLGVNWGPMCCEKHTTAFDPDFFRHNLPQHGFEILCFSDPYPQRLTEPVNRVQLSDLRCDGDELVVCAWRRASDLPIQKD